MHIRRLICAVIVLILPEEIFTCDMTFLHGKAASGRKKIKESTSQGYTRQLFRDWTQIKWCQLRFTFTDRSKAEVLMLFVLCVALWLLAARLFCVYSCSLSYCCITKIRLFKYIENFTTKKATVSDKKNSDIFHIPAQNIDCGYSLEPPRRGGSNEYPQSIFFFYQNKKNDVYPCKPVLLYKCGV